jgi:hypothetical protein
MGEQIIFSSFNEHDFDASGIYRIAKVAVNGTPSKLMTSSSLSLNGAFGVGDSVYTANGDGIYRIRLDTGAAATVACAEAREHGILTMGRDSTTIVYAQFAGKDAGQELRQVPLGP